jgi:XTP/dITP diphosphohydrolase
MDDVAHPIIVIATQNQGKVREFASLLAGLPALFVTARDAGVVQLPEETGTTFAENAALKARFVADATGMAAIGDDSGIVIDALNGAPGLYSARYGAPLLTTDRDRYNRVLDELRNIPSERRTARFVAALAYVQPDGTIHQVEGVVEGTVADGPRGAGGFGYDPIFVPAGETRTFAEIPELEKNRLSHRARAVALLRPVLVARLAHG